MQKHCKSKGSAGNYIDIKVKKSMFISVLNTFFQLKQKLLNLFLSN